MSPTLIHLAFAEACHAARLPPARVPTRRPPTHRFRTAAPNPFATRTDR